MEEDLREKYMQQRHKKIVAAEAKLIQKQQYEMSALCKKIESTMNERLKQRENEHNKLLQRYQNVKKELENQQNIERLKLEKQFSVRPCKTHIYLSHYLNSDCKQKHDEYEHVKDEQL